MSETTPSARSWACRLLAVGLGVALTWGWRPALVAAAVGFVVLEVVRGRGVHEYDGRYGGEDPAHAPREKLSGAFWIAIAVLCCAAGVEFSLTFWGSASCPRDRAGMGSAAAAAAIGAIVGGLAIGRIIGSRVVARLDAELALAGSFALSLVGFAIAWISSAAVPMVVGLLITGLGMGLQSPLGIARVVHAAGAQVDRGSGLSSVAIGTMSGLAPFLLASVADAVGVHSAFLVVPVFAVIAIVLIRRYPVRYDAEPEL